MPSKPPKSRRDEPVSDPPKKKIGRPRSADPAVTVSFSLPRSDAELIDAAIAASPEASRSAWFRDAIYRKMGRPRPVGPRDVTPIPKKGR